MSLEKPIVGDEIPKDAGVIEVHVREVSQLFNSMDPSPFLDKDLDVDAEEFIVTWAKELPTDVPLVLLVHLDRATVPTEEGKTIRDAVHSFFRHRSDISRKQLRQLLLRGRKSLVIGLVFLSSCILIADWLGVLLHDNRVSEIIRESLVICGWVSMWRPLEIFLYDWWPIRNERRIFDRLSEMRVRIVCAGAEKQG